MQQTCFVQAFVVSVVLFPSAETRSPTFGRWSLLEDMITSESPLDLAWLSCALKNTLCLIAWPRLVSVEVCCIVLHFLEREVLGFFMIRVFLVIFANLSKHCKELTKHFQLLKCENRRKKGKIKSSLFLSLWAKGPVFF